MNKSRIQRLVIQMKRFHLNKLVVTSPTTIRYLTNVSISPGRRLFALVLDERGNTIFVSNRMFPLKEDCGAQILWYSDWDDGTEKLANLFSDGENVGIDHDFSAGFTFALMAQKPKVRFRPGSPAIDRVRMMKEHDEIELMRRSSAMNDDCMEHLIAYISGNLSERELADRLYALGQEIGFDDHSGGAIISYGQNAIDAHHGPDESHLKSGDSIVMDFGFSYRGYRSDMTRTVFFQSASTALEKIYQTVLEAQLAAIQAVRPGVPFHFIDQVARDIICRAGYGEYFPHRVGHGIGLDVHEPPYVVGGNEMTLEPGMIFSIEPGIYQPEVGGVRIEDLILVTEDGFENLNHYTKQLQIIK